MPDDMLEDAIAVSRQHLDEYEFEANGVEVSIGMLKITAFLKSDRQANQGPYGHQMGAFMARVPWQVLRVPRRPRKEQIRLLYLRA